MIRSRLKIYLKGLNQSKLLLTLSSKGINVWDLKKVSYNEMTFYIYSKDYKKFLENIDLTCYNVSVLEKLGLVPFITRNWHRVGLFIGLAFSIYLTMFFALSIWNIQYFVDGNVEKCVLEASAVLNEMGISVGASKKQIDVRMLERVLQAKMPSASIVVVEQTGPNLIISIKEAVIPKESANSNIISKYEGIIESINLASGVVRVDVGDVVSIGQTLIEAGKIGDVFAEANGEVVARVFIQGDAIGSLITTKLIKSGKTFSANSISIWGKNIGKQKSPEFTYYDCEIQETYISQNNLLPLKKTTVTYYELVEVIDILSISDLTESLKSEAYASAMNNFPPNEQELDVKYSIVNEGDYVRVVCTIETVTVVSIKEWF